MSDFKIGETVYVDINEYSARKCYVLAIRNKWHKEYLLIPLDALSSGVLIKRSKKDMWRLPEPELLKEWEAKVKANKERP